MDPMKFLIFFYPAVEKNPTPVWKGNTPYVTPKANQFKMDGNGDFQPFPFIKIRFIIQLIAKHLFQQMAIRFLSACCLQQKLLGKSEVVGAEAPPIHCSFASHLLRKFADTLLICSSLISTAHLNVDVQWCFWHILTLLSHLPILGVVVDWRHLKNSAPNGNLPQDMARFKNKQFVWKPHLKLHHVNNVISGWMKPPPKKMGGFHAPNLPNVWGNIFWEVALRFPNFPRSRFHCASKAVVKACRAGAGG